MGSIEPLKKHEESALEVGRAALLCEAEGLKILAQSLDDRFEAVVDCLFSCQGRVIVSGMGKSGHVGKKMASTFASTGTRALFVHPAEASHGDLGMITREDCVLAISKSGETGELTNLINYTRRFSLPLIAVTSVQDSTLARVSDYQLILPDVPEACPIGLAPTTSTILTMALGDALASALLSRRGFSPEEFSVFHPGGKLGNSLTRVEHCMHDADRLPLIPYDALLSDAILVMSQKGFGCVGILNDDSHLIGIITDGDLRRHMASDLLSKKVTDIMTQNPKVIEGDLLMVEALAFLNQKKITCVFIVEDANRRSKPIGIIHIHDFLRAGTA